MKVLLVEDYAPLARSLAQGLREAGYSVDVTGDGEEALALARANPFDALVLDVMVPGLDGLEILRRLRAAGSTVGVLLVTARDQLAQKIEGLDLGADDYLVKPFAFDEVVALSAREFALLEYLALRRGQVVSRGDVWEHVYDFAAEPSSNVVDVYVGYLRRKLGDGEGGAPRLIHTHRGLGYSIDGETPA
jgi:DNA-binding response OmpR family regulator